MHDHLHFFFDQAPMSKQYLTIKEAAERYSKAEITIRRLVRDIVKKSQHKDRTHIHPKASETAKLKKQKKPFSYAVSLDLLDRTYGNAMKDAAAKVSGSKKQEAGEYLSLLKGTNEELSNQLKVKDEQIRALNQALDDLSERQRETNILMKGLQERLLIEAPNKKRWCGWK